MTGVIDYAWSCVQCGGTFYVNLQKRSLAVNGHFLIKDGLIADPTSHCLGCFHKEDWSEDKVIWAIERRYNDYKHSVPSERSESHRRTYFKALPENELTDEDMMYGQSREFARFELETFVLAMIMCGALTWNPSWGSWFWQSQKDKDLVILREWIEPSPCTSA